MRKWIQFLAILAPLVLFPPVRADVNNPSIVKVASDPTGNACTNPSPLQWYAGTYYGCDNTGHRAAVGSGGTNSCTTGTGCSLANGTTATTQPSSDNSTKVATMAALRGDLTPSSVTAPPTFSTVNLPANAIAEGADPTGTNDSTTALQNCIGTLNCFVPLGSYKFTTLSIPDGLNLYGVSSLGVTSTLISTSANPLSTSATGDNVRIRSLYIDGIAASGVCLSIGETGQQASQLELRDLVINGCTTAQLVLKNATISKGSVVYLSGRANFGLEVLNDLTSVGLSEFDKLTISGNKVNFLQSGGTHNTFRNLYVYSSVGDSSTELVHLLDTDLNVCEDCTLEGNDTNETQDVLVEDDGSGSFHSAGNKFVRGFMLGQNSKPHLVLGTSGGAPIYTSLVQDTVFRTPSGGAFDIVLANASNTTLRVPLTRTTPTDNTPTDATVSNSDATLHWQQLGFFGATAGALGPLYPYSVTASSFMSSPYVSVISSYTPGGPKQWNFISGYNYTDSDLAFCFNTYTFASCAAFFEATGDLHLNYALYTPSATISTSLQVAGGTPMTSQSSAQAQIVTCAAGGTSTQFCGADGAWHTPSAGTPAYNLGAAYALSTTTPTVALTNGAVQTLTLTGNTTIAFTQPVGYVGKVTLIITQAAGANDTVTWTSVKWPSGIAPVMTATASAIDVYSCILDTLFTYCTAGQSFQ